MAMRWVALLLLTLVMGSAAPTAGSPSPDPPFASGTTWLYRLTRTSASGKVQTGTRKYVYGGRTTYRGAAYYYTDESNTVTATTVRTYEVWSNGHLLEAADVYHYTQNHVVEILYDKALPSDIEEISSGWARVIENGTELAKAPWSLTNYDRGFVEVTVPRGKFRARRFQGAYQLGALEIVVTQDFVGLVPVLSRSKERNLSRSGTDVAISEELIAGPVPAQRAGFGPSIREEHGLPPRLSPSAAWIRGKTTPAPRAAARVPKTPGMTRARR